MERNGTKKKSTLTGDGNKHLALSIFRRMCGFTCASQQFIKTLRGGKVCGKIFIFERKASMNIKVRIVWFSLGCSPKVAIQRTPLMLSTSSSLSHLLSRQLQQSPKHQLSMLARFVLVNASARLSSLHEQLDFEEQILDTRTWKSLCFKVLSSEWLKWVTLFPLSF